MSPDSDAHELEDRFKLLADETRLRIIEVLADATGSNETPISYSTLQSRVGVRDNGRLNYHLSKLATEFVTRTDAGYALLPAGRFAHLTVKAQEEGTDDPIRMDASSDCQTCGERLVAIIGRDHTFVVQCPTYERVYLSLVVPFARPGVDASKFLGAMNDTARERFGLVACGLCYWCRSAIEAEVDTGTHTTEPHLPQRNHLDVRFHHRCTTCAADSRTTPGELLLAHPEIVALHRLQGVPLAEQYVWSLAFAMTDQCVEVRSRDPWEITLQLTVGEIDVEAVFDADGDVQTVSTRSHLRGI
jgi:hypothetical protein